MTGKYLKGECQHCGGHVEFPAETVGTTIDCPHCGQPTELLLAVPPTESSLPAKAIVCTVIAIVILVGGLIGAQIALKRARRLVEQTNDVPSPPATKQSAAPAPAEPAPKDGFRVSPVTLEKTPGSSLVYAVGTIRNETNRRRFGVKVEFDLLDAAGTKIGSAKDYQQTLEPKAEWHFRALVVESKAVTAKLATISEDQ